MLDLEALVTEMHDLADEVVRSVEQTRAQRALGLRQLNSAAALAHLRDAVEDFNQDMALPALGLDMRETHAAPAIDDYTVMATDGSQVAPDYHHIAPWYVINSGCAIFRYGAPEGRARAHLASYPLLKPPGRAVRAADDTGNGQPGADARAAAVGMPPALEVDRLKEELNLACRLLATEADPERTVLLLDGPLVQWRMLDTLRRPADRAEIVSLFQRLLRLALESRTPVAGFISRSRAIEWITLLRFTLCPEVAAGGNLCSQCRQTLLGRNEEPRPGDHHLALAGLRDIELAGELLRGQPGRRTAIVELRSKVWSELTQGAGTAGFFYLNTGTEIARVELPRWVWQDDVLLQRLHGVLWDQCEVGGGYPMVLAEAHEAAVVRAPDRDCFYALIERILNERGVSQSVMSAKALSKRRPIA